MCLASTSTTTPSGQWQSVTMTLLSEPSGFTVNTRPPLKSRTTRRPTAVLPPVARPDLSVWGLVKFPVIIFLSLLIPVSIFDGRAQVAWIEPPHSSCGKSWAHRNESFERFKRRAVVQIHSVTSQFRDGDHHEVMLLAEPDEVRYACHGAVVVDDLADHSGGIESRQTGEINCGFCLATPLQNAAGTRAKRENVSRPSKVFRLSVGIGYSPNCLRPIVSGNAGRHAGAFRVNRNRKRGAA